MPNDKRPPGSRQATLALGQDFMKSASAQPEVLAEEDLLLEDVDDDGGFEEEKTMVFASSQAESEPEDDFEDEKTRVFQPAAPAPAPAARRGAPAPGKVSPARETSPQPRSTGAQSRPATGRAQPSAKARPTSEIIAGRSQPTPGPVTLPTFEDDMPDEATVIIDPSQAPVIERSVAPRRGSGPQPQAAVDNGQTKMLTIAVLALGLLFVGLLAYVFMSGGPAGGGAPAAPLSATLRVESQPAGATVLLDGVPYRFPSTGETARTPTLIDGLSAERAYQVGIAAEGFQPASQEVRMEPGEVRSVRLTAEPLPARLDLVTQPAGAAVALNGQPRGMTPLVIENLDPSTVYTLTVTREGYETRVQTLRFDQAQGREQSLVLTLVAEVEAPAEVEAIEEPPPARVAAPAAAPPQRVATPAPTQRVAPTTRTAAPEPTTPRSVAVAPAQQPAPTTTTRRDPREVVTSRPATPAPAPTASPEPRQRPSERSAASTAGTGTLSVNAVPAGQVWINGRQVAAETPLLNHALAPGTYRVQVRYIMSGQFSETRNVTIQAGGAERVLFRGAQ